MRAPVRRLEAEIDAAGGDSVGAITARSLTVPDSFVDEARAHVDSFRQPRRPLATGGERLGNRKRCWLSRARWVRQQHGAPGLAVPPTGSVGRYRRTLACHRGEKPNPDSCRCLPT